MNPLLDPNNHLFNLARLGQRLPHLVVAVILSFAFILMAQFIGGVPAVLIILTLSMAQAGGIALDNQEALQKALLPDTALEQATLLILSFGPIFLVLWGWLAWFEKRPFWTMGLEAKGAVGKYLRGVLVGLLMFVTAVGLAAAFGYIALEAGSSQPQGVMALGGVLLVLLGWIVQGAAEEALTRGWLLPVIGARYNPVLAIIISALVFAVLHSLNPNLSPIAVLNLFLFGIFTALYALYEGGLWGVFSIHTIWNWAQGNLFGFEVSGTPPAGGSLFDLMEVGPDMITGGPFGPEGGLMVTVTLVAGCVVVWLMSQRQAGDLKGSQNL